MIMYIKIKYYKMELIIKNDKKLYISEENERSIDKVSNINDIISKKRGPNKKKIWTYNAIKYKIEVEMSHINLTLMSTQNECESCRCRLKVKCNVCDKQYEIGLDKILNLKACTCNRNIAKKLARHIEVENYLKSKNLTLLSIYKDNRTKMKLRCDNGHIFYLALRHVQQNCGCVKCNSFLTERICRGIIEYIFDKPFGKIRPTFLKLSSKINLELDGYNDDLKLAFEAQGMQHYEWILHFHKTEELFNKQVKYDEIKVKLCKDNNIKLIIIPYTIKNENLYQYIIQSLIDKNVDFEQKPEKNYKELTIYNENEYTTKIDRLLESINLKRISNYAGAHDNITLKCLKCDYEFEKI